MAEHKYTQAEYVLQKVVENFCILLFKLAEQRLTHIYGMGYHFCQLQNIDRLVLTYHNTGALPVGEFSEEWLYEDEA